MAENTRTLKTKPTIQAELYIYIITKYGSNRDDTGCPALCPYIWDFRVSYNITKEKGGKLFQVKRTLGERQTFSLSLSWRTIPIWLLYWFGIAIEPSATLPKLTSCSIAYCKHTAGFLSVQKSHTCGRSNIKSYWDTVSSASFRWKLVRNTLWLWRQQRWPRDLPAAIILGRCWQMAWQQCP